MAPGRLKMQLMSVGWHLVCWKHPLHARPHLAALHTFWHACGLQHLCYATQKYPQPPKAANFMLEVGEQFCVVNKRYSSPASWLS